MDDIVRLHAIKTTSVCDGPGIRMVIFFQGCNRGCAGCHNPETWDEKQGEMWEINNLLQYIEKNAKTKRVTLSGGEPLEQTDAVKKIVRNLSALGYDITLYTGYELEDVPQEILCGLKYVKTGRYIDQLRTTTTPYIGSENQEFIEVEKSGGIK